MKPRLFLITILLIFLLCIPDISFSEASSLTGWNIRKSHIINNASNSGTNYQIYIIVHYGSGSDSGANVYCNSKCQTDFDDIRFTDNDGITLLDYWLMNKTDSNIAYFWIEVTDDLSSDPVTIYVYYGNSGASSNSNFDRTFIFGDPFDSSSLNTTRWTSVDGSPTYTIDSANHYLEVTDMTGTNWQTGKGFHSHTYTMPSYYIIENAYTITKYGFMAHLISGASMLEQVYFISHHTTWGTSDLGVSFAGLCDAWASGTTYAIDGGVGGNRDYTSGELSGSDKTDYFTMLKKVDGKIYVNETTTNRVSETNSETPDRFHLGISREGSYVFGSVQFGAFKIRKFISPEPSHSTWGAEEGLFVYITFIFNSGGKFVYNGSLIVNNSKIQYANGTVLRLMALVEGNNTFSFDNFTWTSSNTYTNNYNLTFYANNTVYCFFKIVNMTSGEAPPITEIPTYLYAIVALAVIVMVYVYIKKR